MEIIVPFTEIFVVLVWGLEIIVFLKVILGFSGSGVESIDFLKEILSLCGSGCGTLVFLQEILSLCGLGQDGSRVGIPLRLIEIATVYATGGIIVVFCTSQLVVVVFVPVCFFM